EAVGLTFLVLSVVNVEHLEEASETHGSQLPELLHANVELMKRGVSRAVDFAKQRSVGVSRGVINGSFDFRRGVSSHVTEASARDPTFAQIVVRREREVVRLVVIEE